MGVRSTTRWLPDRAFLVAELGGSANVAAVEGWRRGLWREVDRMPDGTTFRLLLDLTGYEPASLDAHKQMRTVVPELLVAHGMRPAFVDLFSEVSEPVLRRDRDVVCMAFANVHHDETKMARYQEQIAKPEQRFFTSRSEAEAWLVSAGAR